jgi:hypothetical protein
MYYFANNENQAYRARNTDATVACVEFLKSFPASQRLGHTFHRNTIVNTTPLLGALLSHTCMNLNCTFKVWAIFSHLYTVYWKLKCCVVITRWALHMSKISGEVSAWPISLAEQINSRLHHRALVLDPQAGTILVVLQSATCEALHIVLQHAAFSVICSVILEHTFR